MASALIETSTPQTSTLGRPTECTPEVTEIICSSIRKGLPVAKAAALAGVDRKSVYRWVERGSERDASENNEPYRTFYLQYQKAKADLQISMLSVLTEATEGGKVVARTTTTRPDGTEVENVKYSAPQWTPAAWILERRFPQEFGRQTSQKIDHSGTIKSESVNVNIDAQLSDEQSAQLVNLLRLASIPLPE